MSVRKWYFIKGYYPFMKRHIIISINMEDIDINWDTYWYALKGMIKRIILTS